MKKLLFLALLATIGCIDEVKLEDPAQPASAILVDGQLLRGDDFSTVTLRTFELYAYEKNLPRALSAKTAELVDDAGRRVPIFISGDGTYTQKILKNDPLMPIDTGRSYRVELLFYDGRVFESEWEKLATVPKIDSLRAKIVERDGYDNLGKLIKVPHLAFSLDSKLGAVPKNIRWEMEQSYRLTDNKMETCYPILSLLENEISTLSSSKSQADLRDFPLTETKINYRFAEGFYLIVYQQAVSDFAFGFFEELNQLLAKKGTLFDPPAGAIRSNVVCKNDPETTVHGLFQVFEQDTARLFIAPAFVQNPRKHCPLPPNTGEAPRPTSCDDCRNEAKRSDTTRPDWWEF